MCGHVADASQWDPPEVLIRHKRTPPVSDDESEEGVEVPWEQHGVRVVLRILPTAPPPPPGAIPATPVGSVNSEPPTTPHRRPSTRGTATASTTARSAILASARSAAAAAAAAATDADADATTTATGTAAPPPSSLHSSPSVPSLRPHTPLGTPPSSFRRVATPLLPTKRGGRGGANALPPPVGSSPPPLPPGPMLARNTRERGEVAAAKDRGDVVAVVFRLFDPLTSDNEASEDEPEPEAGVEAEAEAAEPTDVAARAGSVGQGSDGGEEKGSEGGSPGARRRSSAITTGSPGSAGSPGGDGASSDVSSAPARRRRGA